MSEKFPQDTEASWPTLVTDIRLCHLLRSLDIDLPRLGDELREMGMSNDAVAATSVHLGGEDMSQPAVDEGGLTIVISIGEFAGDHAGAGCSRVLPSPPNRDAKLGLGLTMNILRQCAAAKPELSQGLPMSKIHDFVTNPIIEAKLQHPNWYHLTHYKKGRIVYDGHKILAEDGSGAIDSDILISNEHRLHEHEDGPLIRLHSSCIYSETLGSTDCDCYRQLRYAQKAIKAEGTGILVYLKAQEGRGAGLLAKASGYLLKDCEGLDTAEAYEKLGQAFDTRDYTQEVAFLVDKGITKVRLLSNNPRKIKALEDAGIRVTRVPVVIPSKRYNDYLNVKRLKGGHLINELPIKHRGDSTIHRLGAIARGIVRKGR